MITKSFGSLDQFKHAVEQRRSELEGCDSVEFSEDIDHLSTSVEGAENISLRDAKSYEQDQEYMLDDYEVCDDFDCVTC